MASNGTAWGRGFVTGVVAMVAMSFVPWLPVVAALLAATAGAFGPRLAGLSGVLVGFGALWSTFVGSAVATGGQDDQLLLVIATGVVPVVVGIALGVVVISKDG